MPPSTPSPWTPIMAISQSEIINIIKNQTSPHARPSDNTENINERTMLIRDLGLTSVDFVVIFEKIQQLESRRIDFINLIMPDRCNYIDDLEIAQIFNFLSDKVSAPQSATQTDPYINKRDSISQEDINLLCDAIQHQDYEEDVVNTTTQLCFLLSAPRSGSTLLRRMLGCHPDIYAPMELHLMAYKDFGQRQEQLNNEDNAHLLEGTIVARQEVRNMQKAVSTAVDHMYASDHRSVSQFFIELDPYLEQKVLIDKTPTYAFSEATLQRLKNTFPSAKFIHLSRRPNAVVKSLIDSELGQIIRFLRTSGIKQGQFPEALWCLCEQNIQSALKDVPERVHQVDYESIVTSPEKTLASIHKFLGLQPSNSIDPYLNKSETSNEKVESYAGDLKTFLRSSIDPTVASEWEKFPSLQWLSEPTFNLLRNN